MPFMCPIRLGLATALLTCSLSVAAEELSSNLQINGFATAGFSSVTEDFGGNYLADPVFFGGGIDNDGSYSIDNVLGVQLRYKADDRVDLVGQLVSVGRENYATRAEWAYLSYRVDDSLSVRGGRFALPLYMYSESIKVGQAYPWARLPSEVYLIGGFSSVDGVDALYHVALGDADLNLQGYTGRLDISNSAIRGELQRVSGLNATLAIGDLSLRAGYNKADISLSFLSPPVPLPALVGNATSFSSVGMTYDDGAWFAAVEATRFSLDGFYTDTDAAFVSVGHYVGKWLPYAMFSKSNAVKGDECRGELTRFYSPTMGPASPAVAESVCRGIEKEQTSYSLGARYDISRRTSLKMQVDHVTAFHNTPGFFYFAPGGSGPASGTLSDDESTEVITVNINTAF